MADFWDGDLDEIYDELSRTETIRHGRVLIDVPLSLKPGGAVAGAWKSAAG